MRLVKLNHLADNVLCNASANCSGLLGLTVYPLRGGAAPGFKLRIENIAVVAYVGQVWEHNTFFTTLGLGL